MPKRVYTFSNIAELKNAPYFAEIAALPQITMSREMAYHMVRSMRVFKGNVLDFSSFALRIFPDWNTSGQKFAYITALNRLIREKIERAGDSAERDWLLGCKKNLYAAIMNILRLEEAKIRPEDVDAEDRDIGLFLDMWTCLLNANDSILSFRRRLAELQDPMKFDEAVQRIFRFHGQKKIVLHGFQFFTPIQQFIYDCFERAGYEIYALIEEDTRYPYAHEIWDHLYTQAHGFPNRRHWIRAANAEMQNPLGEIFETGGRTTAAHVRILRYRNTVEFVEDIPRLKEAGFYLYSADDRGANTLLKDYYPERYEVRNLLAYPIGQFIYTLHKMWDERRQCITLTPDGLRKCFASGWLSAHGESSMKYTDDLERLLPYFEDCYTISEWSDRLAVFSEAYDEAVSVFAEAAAPDGVYHRNLNMLGNPFHYFSPFSIKENHIDEIISILRQLIQMAKTLFGRNEAISIHEHMSRLDTMLSMQDGMPSELYREEREKVKQIFDALESEKVRDFLCYPGDLAAALLTFMGGQIEDGEENNRGLQTLVFNIFQVESAPIASKGKVHICLSDSIRLPGADGRYTWPMDEALLEKLVRRRSDSYVSNWLENNQLTMLSNRYYTFIALQNPEVEISWIQQQGEKILAPSPYITLLDRLTDAKILDSARRKLEYAHVAALQPEKRLEDGFNLRAHPTLHIYDGELEYALCPMRFVYSYVLGDNPSYRSEFQQQLAMARLIQILKTLLGTRYTIEVIAAQVFALFPSVRKAEKRQILDDAMRSRLPENDDGATNYGDYNYTSERLRLTFPDATVYEDAKRQAAKLMSPDGRKSIGYEQRGGNDAKNCMFCPHAGYCMKSWFGVDYKGEAE